MSQLSQCVSSFLDCIQFTLIFHHALLKVRFAAASAPRRDAVYPTLIWSRRRRSPAQFFSPQALENGRQSAHRSQFALHPFYPQILLPVALTPVGGAFREELYYEAYAAGDGELPRQRVVDWWNSA